MFVDSYIYIYMTDAGSWIVAWLNFPRFSQGFGRVGSSVLSKAEASLDTADSAGTAAGFLVAFWMDGPRVRSAWYAVVTFDWEITGKSSVKF